MAFSVRYEWDNVNLNYGETVSPNFIASPDDTGYRWFVFVDIDKSRGTYKFTLYNSTSSNIYVKLAWKVFNTNNELIFEEEDNVFRQSVNGDFDSKGDIPTAAVKSIKRICLDIKLSRHEPVNQQLFQNPSSTEEVTKVEVEKLYQKSTDKVLEDLLSLYESKEFSDITIECGERKFEVHKQILVSRSSVFRTMFKNNMAESISKTIKISDIDPEAMSDFLKFLYSGKLEISKEILFDILDLAERYDVQDLKSYCEVEMKINIEVKSAVNFLITADKYGLNELKETAFKFIKENRKDVKRSDSWNLMKNHFELMDELLEYF